MAAAAIPLLVGAGELAAQTGVAIAAGKAINYGLNKGIPKLLSKAKKFTAKHKKLRGVSKAIGKVERGYQSKAGRYIRGGVAIGGSLAAGYGAGKAISAAKSSATLSRAAKETHIGRALSGRKPRAPRGSKKDINWKPSKTVKHEPIKYTPKSDARLSDEIMGRRIDKIHPQSKTDYSSLDFKSSQSNANNLSNMVKASGIKKSFTMGKKESAIFNRPIVPRKN